MISERSFQTIMAFADEVLRTEWGPSRERSELISARAELDRAYWRAQERAVAAADSDPEAARHAADAALVDKAVRHHTRAALLDMTPGTQPQAGDMWPTASYAAALWHLTRAQLLEVAPVDVAAAHLREEAHAALDTNPKDA